MVGRRARQAKATVRRWVVMAALVGESIAAGSQGVASLPLPSSLGFARYTLRLHVLVHLVRSALAIQIMPRRPHAFRRALFRLAAAAHVRARLSATDDLRLGDGDGWLDIFGHRRGSL